MLLDMMVKGNVAVENEVLYVSVTNCNVSGGFRMCWGEADSSEGEVILLSRAWSYGYACHICCGC